MEAKILDVSQDDRVIEFKIKSRNSEGEECEVKRTLDDFMWLHDELAEKNVGLGIPGLPQKPDLRVSFDYGYVVYDAEKYDGEKIENDIKYEYLKKFEKTVGRYQLFLDRVTSLFGEDTGLSAFLTFQQNLETKITSPLDSLFKKLKDSKLSLNKLRDNDECMQEKKENIGYHLQLMSDIEKKHCGVVRANINLTLALFGASFTCPVDSRTYFCRIRTFERSMCDNMDKLLVEAMTQSTEDLRIIKQLIMQRYYFYVVYDEACKNLEIARVRGRELSFYEEDKERALNRFTSVDQSVKEEITTWNNNRHHFVINKLKQLARVQVEQSSAFSSYLKTCLQSL